MRPIFIPGNIKNLITASKTLTEEINVVRLSYKKLRKAGEPMVSIIIPAFNEEKNILQTLLSLSKNKTIRAVEIIVVNNNSTDNTSNLVQEAGITCVLEKQQGITAARNAGLLMAKGTFILNADADAIYPPDWIDEMVNPLAYNKKVAITYGRFSFLPTGKTNRVIYFFYEYAADVLKIINKYFKEEAVNVYGFNSGYRRIEGLEVNGYDHPPGTNEDGFLALKLRNKGFGKLYFVTSAKALVWTSDRRIQIEGGFLKGIDKRFKKFLFPKKFVQLRTDI